VAVREVASGRALTWGDLDREASSSAALLRRAGVRPRDRVAVSLPRCAAYLTWLLGIWRADAVAVPLDAGAHPAENAAFLRHAECSAVVGDADYEDVGLLAADAVRRPVARRGEPSPEHDALLLYTSGSTGVPRAVRHTHASIGASARALRARYHLGQGTRVMNTLPLSGSHGLFVQTLSLLAHGGTVLLAPLLGPFEAHGFWDRAAAAGTTFMSTVPAVLKLLLRMAEGGPPPGMRLFTASAPLDESLREEARARWGVRVINCFGMSEAAGWFLYGGLKEPPGCVGKPTRCRVRFLDDGEMLVRGAQVTPGYWRGESFEWLPTGDLARTDVDGRVILVGRKKRVIQRAGRSVYPEDIERALAALPHVREAAVVGVLHDVYGEVPRAFVVPAGETSEGALLGELRQVLSTAMLPQWIDLVPDLPRLRGGKTDLVRLAALGPRRAISNS